MLQNLLIVSEQVGVLFLLMGVGFVLGRLGRIDAHTSSQMSTLLLYVVSPCVIIDSLQVEFTAALMRALLWGCVFLVGQYVALILLSQRTFKKQPRESRSVLRFAQVYSNNVFMGLPLLQAVLGTKASVFVVPSMIMFNVFQWSHGVCLMGGRISLKRSIINPGMIGITIGMALFLARITLPGVLGDAVSFLGRMNTPMAMVIIGVQMAGADLKSTFNNKRLYAVTAVRLLVSPLVTMGIMLPFLGRVDPDLFCALIILSAAPSAGVTSILAQQHRQDTASAAQVVSLSTLLSLLTLPLFAVAAQALAF